MTFSIIIPAYNAEAFLPRCLDSIFSQEFHDYEVIVNCTPLGMWPKTDLCPDIPYTFLSENHVLLDVIANPDETLFMKKGREHGVTAKGGKDMLEQQAVAAWNIWNRIGE